MKKIRLLIIEKNLLLSKGIVALLKNQRDISIVAVTGKNVNITENMKQLKPNVILMNLGLRNQSSLTEVETFKKKFPHAKVIIMDLAPVPGDIDLFIKAGASGFILKDATFDYFLQTIRGVAKGIKILPPDINETLFSQIIIHALKDGKIKLSEAVRMTKREKEIIGLIADGLTNKEIAKKLRISLFTVKSQVHNIMEKLALHKRLEIVDYQASTVTLKKIIKDITDKDK